MGTFPISPVDANSRPSLCLTNFLLGGRSVMLEQPRKSGSKFLSHMLTSHGGQIYIHQLVTGKSILDDPPSISEGPGGRVIDYRIQVSLILMYTQIISPSWPLWIVSLHCCGKFLLLHENGIHMLSLTILQLLLGFWWDHKNAWSEASDSCRRSNATNNER